MKYPKLEWGQMEAIVNKLGGMDGVASLLAGKMVVAKPGATILAIDRSIRPTYLEWTRMVMHPELENTGPSHFNPSTAMLYLHPLQKKDGRIGGEKLYAFLKDTGLIEHCLDLRVGEELQKNPHLFPKEWKGKAVFLWKSVVRSVYGNLSVPYVIEVADGVYVYWDWLDNDWNGNNPAALSAS